VNDLLAWAAGPTRSVRRGWRNGESDRLEQLPGLLRSHSRAPAPWHHARAGPLCSPRARPTARASSRLTTSVWFRATCL